MKVIPVIDLLDGVVVHAKKGNRAKYLPIESQLTPSCKPLDIVTALLDVFPFKHLYIADLNAIQKLNPNFENNYSVIDAIKQCYPELELWVDAGISCNSELSLWKKLNVRLIIGSEKFAKISNFTSLNIPDKNFILSLDYMPQGYQGPAELLRNSDYWPQNVIVMSLNNVGSNNGVNIELMREIVTRAKGIDVVAAGGIRNTNDLAMLNKIGVNAALIATSLHLKQITTAHLEVLCK